MKKKIMTTALCMAMALSVAGCDKEKKEETTEATTVETTEEATDLDVEEPTTTQTTTENLSTEDNYELLDSSANPEFVTTQTSYEEVIARYKEVLALDYGYETLYSDNMSILFVEMTNPLKDAGYKIMDINSDGVDELVIGQINDVTGWKGIVFSVYTMRDGKIVQLFACSERNRYFITSDNTILNSGSGSAFEWATFNYELKDSKLVVKDGILVNLDENSVQTSYKVTDDTWNAANGVKITDEEADNMDTEYSSKIITLDYTPFN